MLLSKRGLLHIIIYNGSSTIPDLSKELDLSVPTVTKFIGEMCDDGYINDYGKLETSGGRHPNLYGLIRNPVTFGCRHQKIRRQYRTDKFQR